MSYRDNIPYIEYIKKFVAKVIVYDSGGEEVTCGTGFFVDERTLITAHHVIRDGIDSDCEVKIKYLIKGKEMELPAKVFYTNPGSDINKLTLFESVELSDDQIDFPKITRNAFRKREFKYAAYGYPKIKTEGHYQQGIILDENKLNNGDLIIDISLGEGRLDKFNGYSGSPVVCNGQLIGIAIEQTTGLGRSQSIKILCFDTLDNLIDERYFTEDLFVKETISSFNQETKKEIINNKKNKKYIPEIYVEIGEIKDYLRSFTDPVLFFHKHLDYNKKHSFSYFNRLLNLYGLKEIESLEDDYDIELNNLNEIADFILGKLESSQRYLDKLSNYSEIKKEIPNKKLELFEVSYYTHRPSLLRYDLEKRVSLFEAIKYREILLTERAGQGKTNLLCDLCENVLLKKGIPCLFVGARNLVNNDLGSTMLSIVNELTDIDQLFEVLNFHAFNIQQPFVLVVDAINEFKEISESKKKLYLFMKKAEKYNYIRVLLTARTEYFEEKFGDFKVECPNVMHIEGYNWRSKTSRYKKRVYQGYMNHFNIEINDIGDSIYNELTDDFLLLRMFSEAYQDEKDEINYIPSLQHLFRYEIFERYYNYKKGNLQEWDRRRGFLDSGSTYDSLINSITFYMINHMQFSNIDRSVIVGKIRNELLVKLIDEDIIFRKDIKKKKGLIDKSTEVINFTFDEFRDFCIVKFILEKFDEKNPNETEKLIKKLADNELEIAEGVQRYLFFAGKKFPNKIFIEIIQQQEWYMHAYTDNIFSLDEKYITEEDTSLIINYLTHEDSLKRSESLNAYTVMNLFKRMNINVYKKLNIKTLNAILQTVDNQCFNKYYQPIFKPSYEDRYGLSSHSSYHLPVDKIVPILKRKMKDTLNIEIIILLSLLDYLSVYVHDFFEWCITKHKIQFVSIIETILESDNKDEIEAIKRTVRDLSYYKFKNGDSIKERWEYIQELCEYKLNSNTGLENFSLEELMEIFRQGEED
ncbi:serine protease [Natronospora cellulosivora (SeqCode)]